MGGFQMEDVKVDKKLFRLFIGWYNDNVGDVYSHSVTPADRINYINYKNELVGFVYYYMEESYYIKKKFYDSFVKVED